MTQLREWDIDLQKMQTALKINSSELGNLAGYGAKFCDAYCRDAAVAVETAKEMIKAKLEREKAAG